MKEYRVINPSLSVPYKATPNDARFEDVMAVLNKLWEAGWFVLWDMEKDEIVAKKGKRRWVIEWIHVEGGD